MRAFRDFVFNPVFLVGLIVGLILGIVASFIFVQGESPIGTIVIGFVLGMITTYWGNSVWEKHKKKQRGDEPYLKVSISQNNISIEGQFQKTESNLQLQKLYQSFRV